MKKCLAHLTLVMAALLSATQNQAFASITEHQAGVAAVDAAAVVVRTAKALLGTPFKMGGVDAGGFDCSGFTRYVIHMSRGALLPRRAEDQATQAGLSEVAFDALKPGDLVFFRTSERTFSHVGIYIGEGKFIHSPSSGGFVRVESLRLAYWTERFTGARRVV